MLSFKRYSEFRPYIGLMSFSRLVNPGYYVYQDKLPLTYYNPYYKKDLPLRLADFYVASSNRSYQPCGTSYDVSSYEAIKAVLNKGARFIHLTIFPSKKDEDEDEKEVESVPMIRGKTGTREPLEFDKCCELLSNNGWNGNNYPLFVYLEMGEKRQNEQLDKKIARSLLKNFKNQFIDKKYSFARFNLGQVPIEDTLGRIIILSNRKSDSQELLELTHGIISEDDNRISIYRFDENTEKYGGLLAKHSNKQEIIDYNKKYLSYLYPVQNQKNVMNYIDPKVDLINPDPVDAHNFGIHFVAMNYQLYDEHMKKNIEIFKNNGLVLKPKKLRDIPKPPTKIRKQKKKLSYAPQRLQMYNGWVDLPF